jgi:drug/metabolite transporter (DMT)-like permease
LSAADLARLVVLAACWGLAFVFIRVAVVPLGPVALVELRQLVAGLLLVAYVRALGIAIRPAERWHRYLLLALLNSALPFVLVATAEKALTASFTVILVSTSPLFAALVASFVLKDPLTPRKLAGLALGVAGVALLVGWNPAAAPLPPLWAVAAALGAALLYAIAGVYTRVATQDIPPLATAAGTQSGAALLLLPFVAMVPPQAAPTAIEWLSVAALGLFSSALAFILYFQLIRNVGPVKTLTVNFLSPLFGVGGGALLLGERITANMLAGTVAVLAATALVIGARPAPR